MPIFDRRKRPAIAVLVAFAIAVPVAATNAFSFATWGNAEIIVAAGSEPTEPARADSMDAAKAGMTAEINGVDNIDALPKPKQAHAWFLAGSKAYNAGQGQLAVDMWIRAADRGHIGAQWNLARLYRRGDIVAADPVKALTYIRIVADQHDPNRIRDRRSAITVAALVELADIYRAGETKANLIADPKRASAVYKIAASLYSDARAQHELGMMYLTGEGVRQHFGRAIRWLGLSAGKRYAPSFAVLGDFFWGNRDSGDNKVRGLMWLSLARDHAKGDELRAIVNDRYEAAMTEANDEERQQAMGLIESWNQTHATQ